MNINSAGSSVLIPPLDFPKNISNKMPNIEKIIVAGRILFVFVFLTTMPKIKTKESSQIIVPGKHSMQFINSSNIMKGKELNKYNINRGKGILLMTFEIFFLNMSVKINAIESIAISK